MRLLLGGRRQRPDQLGFGDTVFYCRGTLTYRGRVNSSNYMFSFNYGRYYGPVRNVLTCMSQPWVHLLRGLCHMQYRRSGGLNDIAHKHTASSKYMPTEHMTAFAHLQCDVRKDESGLCAGVATPRRAATRGRHAGMPNASETRAPTLRVGGGSRCGR